MLYVWYMSRTIHGAYSCENGVPLTFPIFCLRVYRFPKFFPFNMAIFKSPEEPRPLMRWFHWNLTSARCATQVFSADVVAGSAPSAVQREILERNEGFGTIIKVNGGFHRKILCKRSEMVGFSNIIWDPWSLGTFCAGFHGDHGVPTKAFNIF